MRAWYGRGQSLQVAVTACCLVAFILFGYDQGVFSGIVDNEDWNAQFNHPDDTKEGIIVSCYNLGCLLGCVGQSKLSDKSLPNEYQPNIQSIFSLARPLAVAGRFGWPWAW